MFLIYIIDMARSDKNNLDTSELLPNNNKPVFQLTLIMLVGIIALFLGGKWVVDGAVTIAANLGMSQSLIGLTIVAVGTSLPELVTSVVASYRGKSDIAVGNVVGSNIFNLLWVLGLSATIRPLPFTANSNADVLMIVFSSTLIILALVVNKKNGTHKGNWHLFPGIVCCLYHVPDWTRINSLFNQK
jgi:cation:H+ antiporter